LRLTCSDSVVGESRTGYLSVTTRNGLMTLTVKPHYCLIVLHYNMCCLKRVFCTCRPVTRRHAADFTMPVDQAGDNIHSRASDEWISHRCHRSLFCLSLADKFFDKCWNFIFQFNLVLSFYAFSFNFL